MIVLESLKLEHERAINSYNSFSTSQPNVSISPSANYEHKIPFIEEALEKIRGGLQDAEVIMCFSRYIELLEAENMKLQLYNKRQSQETAWLREELKNLQSKLESSEAELAKVQIEKNHLEFLIELKALNNSAEDSSCNLIILLKFVIYNF
ncbi:unnamed protein product [Protopolystoma xenopodis]|uniref:Uncharacterized protein n=1 Tax=Protopolystoma xenopodis TaxID=117903 RepID=A0A448X2X3_9PLAT|nr:unnamed protein product [Protopolystoma xenopodis]